MAYERALARAQAVADEPNILSNIGRVGKAFKVLITFGEKVANLDPTGSTRAVVAVCAKAWESLEQQEEQNVDLNNFVERLAAIVHPIKEIEEITDENISKIVQAMLDLIEDASVFIIHQKSRQSIYNLFNLTSQRRFRNLILKFEDLTDAFDRAVIARTLQMNLLKNLEKLNPVGHAGFNPKQMCMSDTREAMIDEVVNWTNIDQGKAVFWIYGFAGLGKTSVAASVCQRLQDQGTLAASFFCKRDDPNLRNPLCILNTIAFQLAVRYKPYALAVSDAIQNDGGLCGSHIQRRYAGLLHKPLGSLKTRPTGILVVVIDALDECEGDAALLLESLQGLLQLVPWLRLIVTSRPEQDIKGAFSRGDDRVVSRDLFQAEASQDIDTFIRKSMADIARKKCRGKPFTEDTIQKLTQRSNGLFIWAATACKFIAAGPPTSRTQEILEDTNSNARSHPVAALDGLYEGTIRRSMGDDGEDNRRIVRRALGAIVCISRRTPLSVLHLEGLLSGELELGELDSVVKALGSVIYEDGGPGGPVRIYHPSFEDYLITRSEHFRVDLAELESIMARCCLNVMLKDLRFNICGLETSYLLNRDILDLQKRICGTIGMHLQYSCLHWSSHLDMGQRGLEETLRSFLFGETLIYWIEVLSLLNKLDVGLSSLLKVSSSSLATFSDCSSCADDAYRFTLAFYDAISESTPHLYLSALAFAPAKSGIAQRMRPRFPNIPAVVSGGDEEWPPRLQTRQTSSAITVLKLTSDSSRIISGHGDGSVQVWNVDTGALVLGPIETHAGGVDSIAVGCGDRLIASIHWGTVVRVWSIETSAEILAAKSDCGQYQSLVTCVEFSTSGDLIASGSRIGELKIWRVKTGESVLDTRIDIGEGHLNSILFHHHQLYILSGLGSNIITHVWNGSSSDVILSPAQFPRGWSYLASCSTMNLCLVACEKGIPRQSTSSLPDDDPPFVIRNLVTGAKVSKIKPGLGSWQDLPNISAFSPDGRYFVSTTPNYDFHVLDTRTGDIVHSVPKFEHHMLPRESHLAADIEHRLIAIAFSPRNHRIISASRSSNSIHIWSSDHRPIFGDPGQIIRVTPEVPPDELGPIALSPDSYHILSNGLYFSDSSTGALIRKSSNTIPANEVQSLAFSPDGRFIALGLIESTRVVVCDANSGAIVYELEGAKYREYRGRSVSFLGRNLVCSYDKSNGSLCAWDLETQTVVRDLPDNPHEKMRRISTSSDGKVLAFYTEDTVEVIEAENWTRISLLQHQGSFRLLNFSPDGRKIVSASTRNSILLWDAAIGTQLFELQHDYKIDYKAPIACSHNSSPLIAFGLLSNRTVVSYALPGTNPNTSIQTDPTPHASGEIQILDTAPGAPQYKPIRGHSGRIEFIEFCPESRRIVSYSSKIRVYDIDACVQEVDASPLTIWQSTFSSTSLVTRAQIYLLSRYLTTGLRSPTPLEQNSRLLAGSPGLPRRLGG
ncbi:hypothetical protein FRC12_004010 [Ceratobasidium sp. 428]|nr:hypothetical protein FRC12_004010 [Ceratobasidium sp. 428]